MRVILATIWWSLLIRGFAALALAVLLLILREISLSHLALLFFGYAMIDGVVKLAGAITAAQSHQRWGSLLLEAIGGIAAGLISVAWPGVTVMRLIYIIAGWSLATGLLEIFTGLRWRTRSRGKWMLASSGAASIALGIVMVAVPLAGATAVAFWLGVYAFVFGVLMVDLAFQQRAQIGIHRAHRVERPA
jgi:uncharacterized membrane protein HdeD (DUF308 family)